MRTRKVHFVIFLGLGSVALAEAATGVPLAMWVLFIPFVCLSFFQENPRLPLFLAALSTLFVLGEPLLQGHHLFKDPVLWTRRGVGVVSFWCVAFIVKQAIANRQAHRTTTHNLKIATEDLEVEKGKLERSNKELEQFASIAAHDLRAPLKTMRSWADMLQHLIPEPHDKDIKQALMFVRSNATKADLLVGDILRIARLNGAVPDTKKVDLTKLVKNVLAFQEDEIKESGARIYLRDLPVVSGNSSYLESLFGNLLRNAIIFRDKSRIPEIEIGCRDQANAYHFYIKDNGVGIEARHRDEIFEMFKRLRSERDYEGTGIGLAYCKKVVELRGGRIWVESIPGQGSTFCFTYPKHYRREITACDLI